VGLLILNCALRKKNSLRKRIKAKVREGKVFNYINTNSHAQITAGCESPGLQSEG
jgi:hypothetical protein